MLYFVGPSAANGSWICSDNEQIAFADVLRIWKEYRDPVESRLVLLIDSPNASQWLKLVRQARDVSVALQTYESLSSRSAGWTAGLVSGASARNERGAPLGCFLGEWLRATGASGIGGSDGRSARSASPTPPSSPNPDCRGRAAAALRYKFAYALSSQWHRHRYRLPTGGDLSHYFNANKAQPRTSAPATPSTATQVARLPRKHAKRREDVDDQCRERKNSDSAGAVLSAVLSDSESEPKHRTEHSLASPNSASEVELTSVAASLAEADACAPTARTAGGAPERRCGPAVLLSLLRCTIATHRLIDRLCVCCDLLAACFLRLFPPRVLLLDAGALLRDIPFRSH